MCAIQFSIAKTLQNPINVKKAIEEANTNMVNKTPFAIEM